MIHIVFQQADVDTLQKAIELDESLKGDIIEIQDELAVGPIADIFTEEGYNNRVEWWRKILEHSPYPYEEGKVDDRKKFAFIKEHLDANFDEQAWVWIASNQHDVCGYYWLISQLKEYERRVNVLSLNNLPFINDKGGIFYPTDLHQIPAKEFVKAKKLVRPVTTSEFELDSDEWKKLCSENAIVRVSDGGKKIISKEASYYDDSILASATIEPQKLQKIFQTLFSKMKLHTGDVFLVWRMKELINEGKLELIGDWNNGWKDISLKLPGITAIDNKPELDITV